jgi:hypothetical protein
VVFTDNGSKDLKLKDEILKLKKKKELEIYIVLTPDYEGRPNDESLKVLTKGSLISTETRSGPVTLFSKSAFQVSNKSIST